MAITPTSISSIVIDRTPQIFADAVSRNSEGYNFFDKVQPTDSKGPRWQAKTVGRTAVNYALGGAFPAGAQFQHAQASLAWGRCVATIELYGQAMDELDAGSPLAIDNYLREQFDDATMAMVAKLDAEVWGAVTANGMTGLQTAIDSTGTYAGINRASVTNWASAQGDNSGTPRAVTKALMDALVNTLLYTNKGRFTHVLTTPAIGSTLEAVTSGAGVPALRQNITSETTLMNLGFGGPNMDQTLIGTYKGRPVHKMAGLVAGAMYFINKPNINIEVLRPFRSSTPKRENDDLFFDVTHICQLKVINPRKDAAVLEDLT
jgi:hypothetical protein